MGNYPQHKGTQILSPFQIPKRLRIFARKKTAGAATPSGPKGKEKLIRPYFRGLEGDCQV
jgi:hypothetical protein